MKVENILCTGCSLLCDDVDCEIEGGVVVKAWGSCSHGTNRLKGFKESRLEEPLVEGSKASVEEAVEALAEKLKSSKAPAIYGGGCSSNRCVELALKLAEKLEAVYDAPPSICRVLIPIRREFNVEASRFEEVLDEADFVLYWGVSIADTHLRHASRYTVMPRGSVIKMGRENRVVAMVDVRESMSMKIAQHKLVVGLCGDASLAKSIVDALQGMTPQPPAEVPTRQVVLLASDLKSSSFTAIFLGSGLLRCRPEESIKEILKLAEKLREKGKCSVQPVAEEVNSYGQAELSLKLLGTCSPYSFKEKAQVKPLHELVAEGTVDFVFSLNTDLLSSIPMSSAKHLQGKLACTTELKTLTQAKSSIAIPVQALGIEAGGTVTRTDGVEVELKPFLTPPQGLLSEEEVLSRLLKSL